MNASAGKFNKVLTATEMQFPLAVADPAQVTSDVQAARSAAQSSPARRWRRGIAT